MLQLLLASRPHIRIIANKRLVLCVLMTPLAIYEGVEAMLCTNCIADKKQIVRKGPVFYPSGDTFFPNKPRSLYRIMGF
uniref:Putative secreted protein n=1 Tax=Anopheles triannulatus TaxID=58253 RepID=A0A2M4B751_9DIPT